MTYPPQQPDPWSGQPPYGPGSQPGPYEPDPGAYGGSNGYGPGYGPQDYGVPSVPPDYGQPSVPPDYGQPSAPPGYQDPYGYQQPGYQPTQPFGGPGYPPPVPPKKSSPLPWILGGVAALVVVVLVIVGVAVLAGGRHHPPAARSGSPSASASASPSPTVSTDPTRVTDTATGISFKKLGSPWEPVTFNVKEFTHTSGEQAPSEADCSDCYAVISMGPLNTSTYPYTGPSDLQKDTDAMAGAMVKEYYPKNAKPDKKYSDAAGTQDGHQVWVWAYHLSYSASGMTATGESVEVAVVDLGGGKAGGFYTSVPDTNTKDLLPQVETALNSLTIAS